MFFTQRVFRKHCKHLVGAQEQFGCVCHVTANQQYGLEYGTVKFIICYNPYMKIIFF